MNRRSKDITCFSCSLRTERVDWSTQKVICGFCVQRRIQILNEFGSEIFIKSFYKLPKAEGQQLLSTILQSKREGTFAGDKLRAARKRKGWSQLSLAAHLGVSKTSIVAMENNRKLLNIKALDMINSLGD